MVLSPESRYSWSYAVGEGPVVGRASFETLPMAVIQAADKARAAAKGFSDLVLLALVLQELGAVHDARELWVQLSASRPDLPEIVGLAR